MESDPTFLTDTRVARAPEQISGDIDGQVVLLSMANEKYFKLNEVGSRIWELMEKPITVADIIAKLRTEFDVPEDQCEKQVIFFLRQLKKTQLLDPKMA
jgi:hypothetical protein